MKLRRFVLYSPTDGIYLGNAMGLGFWSLLDPADQPAAVTFPTPDAAFAHVLDWDNQESKPVALEVKPVEVEVPAFSQGEPIYATIAECVAAGLPGWETDTAVEQLLGGAR